MYCSPYFYTDSSDSLSRPSVLKYDNVYITVNSDRIFRAGSSFIMMRQKQIDFEHGNPFSVIILFSIAMVLVCLAAAFVMKVDEIQLTEEHRAALKQLSLSNFLEPRVMGISIVGFFVAVCYSSVLSFLATYAAELKLMTAGTLFFVVYALSITLARPVAGVMFDRKGEDFVMYPTYACLAIGLLVLSITTQNWEMLVAGVFVGLGYGTFMSNGQAICVKLVEEVRIGVAVSTYFVMLDLGLGVGPYILGAFKESLGFQGLHHPLFIIKGFVRNWTLRCHFISLFMCSSVR